MARAQMMMAMSTQAMNSLKLKRSSPLMIAGHLPGPGRPVEAPKDEHDEDEEQRLEGVYQGPRHSSIWFMRKSMDSRSGIARISLNSLRCRLPMIS